IVPARRRNTFARSSSRRPSDWKVGQRYDGISSRNGVRPLFRIEDFKIRAVITAATKPRTYKPSIAAVGALRNRPSRGRFGMNAATINVYGSSRAEHVMNGAIRIVAKRSRLFSIVRVARIAGTAHA